MATKSIKPPANWRARGPHGLFQKHSDDGGELVNFVDVLGFLILEKTMSINGAVEKICGDIRSLKVAADGDVYALSDSACAEKYYSFRSPEMRQFFAGQRADSVLGELERQFRFDVQNPSIFDAFFQPGGPDQAVFDALQRQAVSAALGVTWAKAHALWGWGTLIENLERVKVSGAPWSDEQDKLLLADFDRLFKGSKAAAHRAVAASWFTREGAAEKPMGVETIKKRIGELLQQRKDAISDKPVFQPGARSQNKTPWHP